MNKICCVEDDSAILTALQYTLSQEGYQVMTAMTKTQGLELIQQESFDLVLLDVTLPDGSGYEICKRMREDSRLKEIPVIFLTAKASVADRVKGLRMGADDYLTKPFEIIELLARVESVLRRYHKTEQVLTEGDLVVDTASRTVTKKGETISLTKKEFDLLLLFVRNKNIALYRETIYERIWGGEYMGDSRTVDLHVQRMRKKAGLEEQIQTVYRVGYRYCP